MEICFFDEKNVKGKAEQRKKAVAAHLQIRGDLTDRNVKKKGIRKCSLTIMLFCPTSFFLGYRKKESNSKRKRAVDCAGNNFLHGQKSTIAQLLSTTYSFNLIIKSVLFLHTGTTLNLAWKKEITIYFEHKSATTQLYEELVFKTTRLFDMVERSLN